MTILTVVLLVAIAAPLVALLERTHRRTATLPRTPFGLDHESYDLAVHRETVRDLAARPEASAGEKTAQPHYRRAA